MDKRIIFSNNGTLEDFSIELNKYESGNKTMEFVAAEDKLYIGSRLPFNSFFIKMSTANTNASTMSVDYWDGSEWQATSDLLDETAGLTQDGHVTFFPDLDESWLMEHTNYGGQTITGLSDVVIYNLYWARISFSADFSANTAVSFVGDLFCNDDDIYTEYPDFRSSNVLTSFESGKTDWEEQRVRASKLLVRDLIDKGIITDGSQILNRRDYTEACVMRTAELIFRSFGDDFTDQKLEARKEYSNRLSKKIHRVDLNKNAIEDRYEMKNKTGYLSR